MKPSKRSLAALLRLNKMRFNFFINLMNKFLFMALRKAAGPDTRLVRSFKAPFFTGNAVTIKMYAKSFKQTETAFKHQTIDFINVMRGISLLWVVSQNPDRSNEYAIA